ncbi:MAG TPA: hypothetical protein VL362_00750, partial [Patescibacteria group bacterium]|nr:hypothetical protein [Patescibacteria group bacterium]
MTRRELTQYRQEHAYRKGVSAIFIVIFAALILSLIAVSFIGLMVKEEGRSTDDEQSQGAYDAAMAGVEDGKRVLLECLQGGSLKASSCNAINNGKCTTVIDSGVAGSAGQSEVQVTSSTSAGGTELNLAYTCVKINTKLPDYIKALNTSTNGGGDASLVVPLKPAGGADVSRVTLYWFSSDDSPTLQVPSTTVTDLPKLSTASWAATQPPVIRAQLIQFESGKMSQANFDNNAYAHTLYLYPTQTGASSFSFGSDSRRSGNAEPLLVTCDTSYGVSGYACQAQLNLPAIPGATNPRVAYLRLTSFYNNAHVRLTMQNSAGTTLNFDGVQSSIDSTGRANDLFRRVESRVEMGSNVP